MTGVEGGLDGSWWREWDGSWTGDPERSSRFWQPGEPGEPGGGNGPSASPLILGPTDPTRQLSHLQIPCCGGCATPATALWAETERRQGGGRLCDSLAGMLSPAVLGIPTVVPTRRTTCPGLRLIKIGSTRNPERPTQIIPQPNLGFQNSISYSHCPVSTSNTCSFHVQVAAKTPVVDGKETGSSPRQFN